MSLVIARYEEYAYDKSCCQNPLVTVGSITKAGSWPSDMMELTSAVHC